MNKQGRTELAVILATGESSCEPAGIRAAREYSRRHVHRYRRAKRFWIIFNWEKKEYEKIPVREQVEVAALIGDVTGDPRIASPFCRALCSQCGHVVARPKPVRSKPAFRTLPEQNTKLTRAVRLRTKRPLILPKFERIIVAPRNHSGGIERAAPSAHTIEFCSSRCLTGVPPLAQALDPGRRFFVCVASNADVRSMLSEHGVHSIDKLEMNLPCAIVWRRFQWVSYAFNETISIVRRFSLMTILPRKGLLAIAVVVDVALQTNGRPISAKTLATRNGLPPRYLESVLQSLVRDGILKGIRGPHGGYELARERRGVTASDILRAAGTVQEAEEQLTSELVAQVVLPVLSVAEQEFGQALSRISLDDMVHRAAFNSNGTGRHKSGVEPHVDLSR